MTASTTLSSTEALPPLADAEALVRAMTKVHRRLAADLRERAADPRVEPSLLEAYASDRAAGRTGEAFQVYREAFCDQVGASWVLCSVFARTLEDRGYLPHRLAGPGAADRLAQFRAQFKFLGERDYLLHVFDGIALLPGGREVFGPGHAPLWRLSASSRALSDLLDELGSVEKGALRFTFGRPLGEERDHDGASTRYLGELYQDLSEEARKRYALLQTPEFVERFLLENTLDPAIRERGVAVTVLDPACGSGHLLLGAYDRLYEARRRVEPGLPEEESAKAALAQVYGIDLNPYAAAIARFRLLLSYLDKAGIKRLEQVPQVLPLKVYVGDSLLAGLREVQGTFGDALERKGVAAEGTGFERGPTYSFFDPEADSLLAKTRFDVIVANPPYITEKDATKRDLIRKRYASAAGAFSLAAPFVERIFELGNDGAFTGQITATSFMKREFGKRLIEEVLPKVDLTEVIDTSGAYIPGHGTPTVILFGRAQRPISSTVRVVMGNRGEPTTPEVPAQGNVWTSITAHRADVGFGNEYISVTDMMRDRLANHPWSLGGGGASELKDLIESRAEERLKDVVEQIGFGAVTREDDLYLLNEGVLLRNRIPSVNCRPCVAGEDVRDWSINDPVVALWPYDPDTLKPVDERRSSAVYRFLWPWRARLSQRVAYGATQIERGLKWFEYSMFFAHRFRTPFCIAFAFVATHNHFALDRGGKVFNRTAPIIKLLAGAAENDHLALLGYLNSSTACFWMKQACFDKGNRGEGGGTTSEEWERFFEFTAGALEATPLPREALVANSALASLAAELSELGEHWTASQLSTDTLSAIGHDPSKSPRHHINELIARQQVIESRIRCLQEKLDWLVYAIFGICPLDLAEGDDSPRAAGERVSDVLYARRVIEEGGSKRYFQLCRLPEPEAIAKQTLSALDNRRLEAIAQNQWLRLLEQPSFKRTYRESFRPPAVHDACESWLLERAEAVFHGQTRPLPVRALAQILHADPKVRAVAEILTGNSTYDLENVLGELLQNEAVASATSQVYTDEGIQNRRLWERTWDLQRLDDAGQKVTIDVPPKYDQKDYENAAVLWRLRGKLDVPKERFIAYPTATPPSGASGKAALFFGWAGWNHQEQLQAAIELWQEEIGLHGHEIIPRATRKEREESLGNAAAAANDDALRRDAAARERLMPILQTMTDLLPWVRQWHNADGETADAFEAYISEQARRLEVSLDEAHAYRRPGKAPGRAPGRPKAAQAAPSSSLSLFSAPGEEPAPDATADAPRRPAKTPRGAPTGDAALNAFLDAVRSLDTGAGVPAADLAEKLGLSPANLKKTVDALVETGRLVEKKKRPRVVSAIDESGARGGDKIPTIT